MGESIGLFANETQLAGWASRELGLDWKNLDEAGKQVARLEFAKAMQESAGATGQASRESDSYQNQLGNVKQAWTDIKAQMAQPFIEPVVNGLKFLSEALQKVDFGSIKEKFEGFKSLFTSSESIFTPFINVFNTLLPHIQTAFSGIVTFIQSQLAVIKQFWEENGTQIMQAVKSAFEIISSIFNAVLPAILVVVKFVWDSIKGVISGALDVIMGAIKIFSGLFTGDFSKMWEGVKQLFSGAITLILNLMNLSFVGALRKLTVNLVKTLVTSMKGMWDDIALRFMYGKDKALSLVNTLKTSAINGFNSLKTSLQTVATNIWNSVKTAFSNMSTSVQTVINALRTVVTTVFNAIKTAITTAVSGAQTTAVNTFNTLKNGAVTAFNSLKSSASTIFNSIKTAITSPIETAKKTVLNIIDTIKDAFSKMKITIPKPKLPKVSVSMGSRNFMGASIPVPDFDISWFKSGGIFEGSRQGSIVGLAEAGGDEAVLPLSNKSKMKPFSNAVASQIKNSDKGGNNSSGDTHLHFTFNVDKMGTDEKSAKDFTNIVMNELSRQMTVNRGMK